LFEKLLTFAAADDLLCRRHQTPLSASATQNQPAFGPAGVALSARRLQQWSTAMSQEFFTIPEAARRLKVHADTISAMGKRGEIIIISIGRARRVVAASIDAFVDRQSAHVNAVREMAPRAVAATPGAQS
jgi:excisionase family DNA binding protein